MTDTFDPFDLPSAFDPLGRDIREPTGQSAFSRQSLAPTGQSAYSRQSLAPTGQSAYSRQSMAPTGQSAFSRQGAPPSGQRREAAAATAEAERPVNHRLAHLLPQAASSATNARRNGTASDGAETAARLATLEDEVAILSARLDDLLAVIDHKLDGHQDRLLRAVATLVEQRR